MRSNSIESGETSPPGVQRKFIRPLNNVYAINTSNVSVEDTLVSNVKIGSQRKQKQIASRDSNREYHIVNEYSDLPSRQ